MADDKSFHLEIVSPDRIFYEGPASMLEITTTEGEIGILKGHIPLTAMIKPCIANIKNGEESRQAAVHDGFIEILQDKVVVLSESCEWPEEIDLNRAKEAQIRAERRLKSHEAGINVARAELALRKSLIRIELAEGRKN